MCDTILAAPASTADRALLFGKNSDRQRNEAQVVELIPPAEHAPGETVRCTYLTLPQVRRTNAVLLCRPFWLWGAEMGANEHGVVIGNEGLYALSAAPTAPALTGMDLQRLALERAASAAQAVQLITELLERYGQGGNCGHIIPSYYHNGFMVADASEAFVLETVGREWLVQRVRTVRAISNEYSIHAGVERISDGLSGVLREFGWDGAGAPDFATTLADPQRSHIGTAHARYLRSSAMLEAVDGTLRPEDLMRILRDHDPTGNASHWNPSTATTYSLCIHAGDDKHNGQTTGSMVSQIGPRQSVHWVTGTAAPCISIFKPVLFDVPLPAHGLRPTDRFDATTLWWRHERLHRRALVNDLPRFIEEIQTERDALESAFRRDIDEVVDGGSAIERARVVTACWQAAWAMEESWYGRLQAAPVREADAFASAWAGSNQLAGVEF